MVLLGTDGGQFTLDIGADGCIGAQGLKARVTGAALDTLTDLAQRARSGTPDWFMSYRQAESEADTLRCWAPAVMPGLPGWLPAWGSPG